MTRLSRFRRPAAASSFFVIPVSRFSDTHYHSQLAYAIAVKWGTNCPPRPRSGFGSQVPCIAATAYLALGSMRIIV